MPAGFTVGDLRAAAQQLFAAALGGNRFRLSDADCDLADDSVEVLRLVKNGSHTPSCPPPLAVAPMHRQIFFYRWCRSSLEPSPDWSSSFSLPPPPRSPSVCPGETVLVIPDGPSGARASRKAGSDAPSSAAGGARIIAPSRERIAFAPHPKTITHAGDYEYFAAQGKAPVAFALSDLIDNALRATKGNAAAGRPRRISVSLLEGPRGMSICVADNGEGMTKRTLNSWRACLPRPSLLPLALLFQPTLSPWALHLS